MAQPAHRSEAFRPWHRLRHRRDFLAAYAGGRRRHGQLVVLFAHRRDDDGPWRLGLTATRKIGKAVVRNRLRRRAREIFRRWGADLPGGWDFVLNSKHGARRADYHALRADVLHCLRRLDFNPAPDQPGATPCSSEPRESDPRP